MSKFCRKCGAVMTSDSVFCMECGVAKPEISPADAVASDHSPKIDSQWATFYTGFGIVSMVLAVITPFLFAGFGYFLGSATKGYSPDGALVSFGIGVVGGTIIFGSGMILMAFGQMLRVKLNGQFAVSTTKYRYTGIAFLFIAVIPFVAGAAACIWVVLGARFETEDGLTGMVGLLLLFIGFVPAAMLYVGGRTLMAFEQMLKLTQGEPLTVNSARYKSLGMASMILGVATPVVMIVFSVVAAIVSIIGVLVGLFLLILGYGIIPGAMLFVAGMILLACAQLLEQTMNGPSSIETVRYKIVGFASIVLGVIVPVTAVVKGFVAVLGTIGAGGLIPALPPLYLGFIGCPVLIIGGVTLMACELLLRDLSTARTN